ncbi:MAG: hypothetical protein QOH42_771 [Blastocatellia bacterium]|jgi:hypothetical protein|nr:hypothetical protein [Blastocatellia bacterium]
MAKSKPRKRATARSLTDLVEWFDQNDIGDYLSQMPETSFDVDIKRRKHLVLLDPELSAKVTELAKAKKTSSETLINSWVREKISEPKIA